MKIKKLKIKKIKTNFDDRGFFQEILRTDQKFKQISYSLVKKNIVKGWHGHKYQSQWTYFLHGRAQVLVKYKDKIIKKFLVDHKKPTIYFLPKKYFHAYKVLSEYAQVIYLTSGTYNPLEDELRESIKKDIFKTNFNFNK